MLANAAASSGLRDESPATTSTRGGHRRRGSIPPPGCACASVVQAATGQANGPPMASRSVSIRPGPCGQPARNCCGLHRPPGLRCENGRRVALGRGPAQRRLIVPADRPVPAGRRHSLVRRHRHQRRDAEVGPAEFRFHVQWNNARQANRQLPASWPTATSPARPGARTACWSSTSSFSRSRSSRKFRARSRKRGRCHDHPLSADWARNSALGYPFCEAPAASLPLPRD